MSDVNIYSHGPLTLSVCAPADMSVDDVEHEVNLISPTGISSQWTVSMEPYFASGHPNPCPCDQDVGRLHYLMHC